MKVNSRHQTFVSKIVDAVEERKGMGLSEGETDTDREDTLNLYTEGIKFKTSLITGDSDGGNTEGLFTGMANVDWLLLAAYHFKVALVSHTNALQTMKGIAGFSMVSPITKKRAAGLVSWEPFKKISSQFCSRGDLCMCPLALTPSRLVNCASLLFTAASDIYILRGEWKLMEIVKYVALQLAAHGGISSLNKEPGSTSSIKWMVHRLLLSGASGDPAVYVSNQSSPLSKQINVV